MLAEFVKTNARLDALARKMERDRESLEQKISAIGSAGSSPSGGCGSDGDGGGGGGGAGGGNGGGDDAAVVAATAAAAARRGSAALSFHTIPTPSQTISTARDQRDAISAHQGDQVPAAGTEVHRGVSFSQVGYPYPCVRGPYPYR